MALYYYIMAMAKEADLRGIKTDKNRSNISELKKKTFHNWSDAKPRWYADDKVLNRVTESHRANLYKKDPEYYGMFREDQANPCCEKCQYFWVTHKPQLWKEKSLAWGY